MTKPVRIVETKQPGKREHEDGRRGRRERAREGAGISLAILRPLRKPDRFVNGRQVCPATRRRSRPAASTNILPVRSRAWTRSPTRPGALEATVEALRLRTEKLETIAPSTGSCSTRSRGCRRSSIRPGSNRTSARRWHRRRSSTTRSRTSSSSAGPDRRLSDHRPGAAAGGVLQREGDVAAAADGSVLVRTDLLAARLDVRRRGDRRPHPVRGADREVRFA